MSIRIKCVIIVVLILGLLKILGLIKKNKLELKYALSWLFLELGILIITLIPNLLNNSVVSTPVLYIVTIDCSLVVLGARSIRKFST